jgi:hypothetical protein
LEEKMKKLLLALALMGLMTSEAAAQWYGPYYGPYYGPIPPVQQLYQIQPYYGPYGYPVYAPPPVYYGRPRVGFGFYWR